MKVQIKNLKPNPFRDMKNYPINQEKVQSLTNSINQTGFWDNILARKNNGNIEIAYGHHRLIVLQKLFKPDDCVNIPVKKLNDSTMIRIMANENMSEWDTNVQIINETVRVTKKFLFSREHGNLIKTKNPKAKIDYHHSKEAFQISEFLGGNWTEYRIWESLNRLGLFDKNELDKEAVESLPTETAAIEFTRITKQIKTTPEQQKQAVKRIIESRDLSKSGMKSALLDEKYRNKKTEKDQREKNEIHFKNYMVDTTKIIKSLNDRFMNLLELQTKYNFNFEIYSNSEEAEDFTDEMLVLISYLKKFSKEGGKKNVEKKLKQICD